MIAAILSAIMSTIDSQLLVSSSALAEDFYKPFIRKNASQKELMWVGRIGVLLIAVIAVLLAYNPDSSVLELVSYYMSIMSGFTGVGFDGIAVALLGANTGIGVFLSSFLFGGQYELFLCTICKRE